MHSAEKYISIVPRVDADPLKGLVGWVGCRARWETEWDSVLTSNQALGRQYFDTPSRPRG